MPPEAAVSQNLSAESKASDSAWARAGIWLGLCWLGLIALFAADWTAMFDQWWNSSSYNHMLLVPPLVGWLAWQRWGELRRIAPQGFWPGLIAVGLTLMVWVLGAFAGFNLLRQIGAVAILPASALALLGPRVFAALLYPFCYMAFMVPFGEELVPALQTITAKITIFLVGISGIPATINGVFIDTPVGLFEVAEACSGVKFLIAMVALGALVGNVCFRSWGRRALFMALCIVMPILANGVRAWGTIFAAQFVGVEKAAGIDHIIYGWIFFALVIALVLGLAWRFFDRGIDDPMISSEAINASPLLARLASARLGFAPVLAAVAALALGSQAWAHAAQQLKATLPQQIFLPDVPGWHRVDYAPKVWWEPRAEGAEHRLLGRYADDAGHQVDVSFALYAAQEEGKEAGGYGQGALMPESGWAWTSDGPAMGGAKSDRLITLGTHERLALTWYRNGEELTGSNVKLKLALIADRLALRAQPTAALILSTEARPGHAPADDLAAFVRVIGPVGPWMDRMAQAR